MRQAGRYLPEYMAIRSTVTFLKLCKRPDLAAEVTLVAQQTLGVDAAILFADLLPILEPMGIDLVWFGIVTVIGAEIGLLTPPLGISCFVIKSTLDDDRIKLKDVFLGALPFAFVMLLVLILIIRYPSLSIGILN